MFISCFNIIFLFYLLKIRTWSFCLPFSSSSFSHTTLSLVLHLLLLWQVVSVDLNLIKLVILLSQWVLMTHQALPTRCCVTGACLIVNRYFTDGVIHHTYIHHMEPVVGEVIDPWGEPTNATFLNKCNLYMHYKCLSLSLYPQIGISLTPYQRSFFFHQMGRHYRKTQMVKLHRRTDCQVFNTNWHTEKAKALELIKIKSKHK